MYTNVETSAGTEKCEFCEKKLWCTYCHFDVLQKAVKSCLKMAWTNVEMRRELKKW